MRPLEYDMSCTVQLEVLKGASRIQLKLNCLAVALLSLLISFCAFGSETPDLRWTEIRVGNDCRTPGWCFLIYSSDDLAIVEVDTGDGGVIREVVPLKDNNRGGGYKLESCEAPQIQSDGRSVMTCSDEPYFSSCGAMLKMNCFEVYDQGSYSVTIVYGRTPSTPTEVIIGPGLEEEEDDDSEDDEDGK